MTKYRVDVEILTKTVPPQPDLFEVVDSLHAWYIEHQNNSGGHYSTSGDVGHFVAFEATSAKVASAKFSDIAESENVGSCECCGDRWYSEFSEHRPKAREEHKRLHYGSVIFAPEVDVPHDYAWTFTPREERWSKELEYVNLVAHYANGARARFTFIPIEPVEDCVDA